MARNATTASPAERLINGVREGGTVWIDLLREGNSRLYRFNRLLLDEAARTQDENADLIRQFINAPARIGDFTSALVDTLQEQGRRRAGLARELWSDLGEAAADTRRLFSRATITGRDAVATTAGADRAENVDEPTQKTVRGVRRTNGRTQARKKSNPRRTNVRGTARRKKGE